MVAGRRTAIVSLVAALWMVVVAVAAEAVDGGRVVPIGESAAHGDLDGVELNQAIVGVAVTPSGNGYWMAASDGGVFGFGDARFMGSMGAVVLNQPVVGMAATPSGNGYWLVARDGGVFSFGDARFWGSTGAMVLNRPVVGMAPTPSGNGYWLLGADGGVFTFGDAGYWGSAPEAGVEEEFVAIVASPTGKGYGLVSTTGEVLGFGDSTLATLAACDAAPVRAAGGDRGIGAVLLRRDVEVPGGRPSSSSTGRDGDQLNELISHAQSCQDLRQPEIGEFAAPLANMRVTSSFGPRVHPVWRISLPHEGIDAIGSGGDGGVPVAAVADGIVLDVSARVAYGTTVVIDHGDRIASVYAHLGAVSVAVGDRVARGQPVGTMGSSGFATGTHLHFELRLEGVAVDPLPYLGGDA